MARCYLEGAGVPPSAVEGARWLERAAPQGYVDAQSMLAALYMHGIPGSAAPTAASRASELSAGRPAAALFNQNEPAKPDFERAAVWARKAADAGSADGQALLGYILTAGPEEMRDLEAAEAAVPPLGGGRLSAGAAWPRPGAAAQRPRARAVRRGRPAIWPAPPRRVCRPRQYLLGVLYEQGQGVEKDVARGVGLYKAAAEKGMRSAQARWGMALMEGRGVERDPLAGESWLRRAAAWPATRRRRR